MIEHGFVGSNGHNTPIDLVFGGGSIKDIGLAGAYKVVEERGYQPEIMAGASAGSIVAALVAAGYSADELYRIMRQLDFNKFEDEAEEDRIPLLPWRHYLDMENLGASRSYGTWTPSAHPVHGSSPLSCQYGDKLAG